MSMGDQEMTPEEAIQALYDYAAALMIRGVPAPDIEKDLVDKGLSADSARTIVDNLLAARKNALKQAGQKNMLYGALWCIGGTLVTIISYTAADSSGGGKYVIAWGAIVFGAFQF